MTDHNVPDNLLIAFFRGTGGDSQGRTLDQILRWSNVQLEECHDYIQTLFPLPEASRFAQRSTLIDEHVFEAFRGSNELRSSLRRALDRMLAFYGLSRVTEDGKILIVFGPDYETLSRNWVRSSDHNHLRITRIIRSLRILGLEEEAEAFYDALEDIYFAAFGTRKPSKVSMTYWNRAAKRPLNFAPDVNDVSDPHAGEEFLWKYEMAKTANEEGMEDEA